MFAEKKHCGKYDNFDSAIAVQRRKQACPAVKSGFLVYDEKRHDVPIPNARHPLFDRFRRRHGNDTLAHKRFESADKAQIEAQRNQRLRVSIMLSEKTYEAEGLIVSVRKNAVNKTFSLGILFTDISDEARNRIFAYVYRYGSTPDETRNTQT